MKRWTFLAAVTTACALLAGGCSSLDEHQRQWIFQPSDRSWGNSAAMTEGMEDIWIDFTSPSTRQSTRLHGLWYGDAPNSPDQPVMLYLHGARFNVAGSAPRIRRMHELGFSVLAIDYRGFGKSTQALPSELSAREDARAAWEWLAKKYPKQPRYIFGHSLGGAIGIDLASQVKDEAGTIVEGTFTSITDVVSSFKWGWLPFSALVTQRFESLDKVKSIQSPLLVVHGSNDTLINPTLGKKLYDAATSPKLFVLVEGGSHHSTNSIGELQYRTALSQLFDMKGRAAVVPTPGPAEPPQAARTPLLPAHQGAAASASAG
ncbi:alpha/beta fold hydrolase [Xenophilus arseniciresistens]|uniref:Alpha/beta fold hydrolase n=1 Tax=Xenophilus arseniciresistens TaxID=1283306 RepID=A0AAE3N707_9BURK|nr:alpha/beta fold hydrolase [Xenophilus arseniciresistens]MDA7415738.1 alpha/beta fold hydrolase [Xenophilus arseniciresistens]